MNRLFLNSFKMSACCLLGFNVAVTGCGKQETPAAKDALPAVEAAPTPNAVAKISTAPVAQPAPPAAPAIAGSASAEAAAGQMTAELRKYVAYTRTIPKNFDDFVAHHPMKFPAPPTGKKYVIEGAQVVVR